MYWLHQVEILKARDSGSPVPVEIYGGGWGFGNPGKPTGGHHQFSSESLLYSILLLKLASITFKLKYPKINFDSNWNDSTRISFLLSFEIIVRDHQDRSSFRKFSVRMGGHTALFWYWSPDTTPSKHSNGKGQDSARCMAHVFLMILVVPRCTSATYSYSRLRTRITPTLPGPPCNMSELRKGVRCAGGWRGPPRTVLWDS